MNQDRDPFLLLPNFIDPEPDPVVMNATIAQSREAFANRQGRDAPAAHNAWQNWLRQSMLWLVPAGVGAAALALTVVVVPIFLPETQVANRDLVADRPIEMPTQSESFSRSPEPAAEAPSNGGGVRMGMQPAPNQGEAAPMEESVVEGDGIRIGTRLSGSELTLYLPDVAGEPVIDSQFIMSGEDTEVLGAFQLEGADIVAVQLRVNDTRFWRIYQPVDGAYARDVERSTLVSDSADRVEVERRLAAN